MCREEFSSRQGKFEKVEFVAYPQVQPQSSVICNTNKKQRQPCGILTGLTAEDWKNLRASYGGRQIYSNEAYVPSQKISKKEKLSLVLSERKGVFIHLKS